MSKEEYVEYDRANEPLTIHMSIIDKMKKEENTGDLISLYVFYYHTAKWQKTNSAKASDIYIKKCMKWGAEKVRRTKQKLQELGLIEVIRTNDKDGKVTGWYVKVKLMFSHNTQTRVVDSQNSRKPELSKPTSGFQDTSALSLNNIIALSLNKEYVGNSPKLTTDHFYLSGLLADFVKKNRHLNYDGRKANSWADHIRKMIDIDGIPFETIESGLQWYFIHHEHKYMPRIDCAKTLREKWNKLIDAAKRMGTKQATNSKAKSNVVKLAASLGSQP